MYPRNLCFGFVGGVNQPFQFELLACVGINYFGVPWFQFLSQFFVLCVFNILFVVIRCLV